jgi:hypothetical protein
LQKGNKNGQFFFIKLDFIKRDGGSIITTTRKKVNSGAQTVTVDIELPPLPCLPAVMPAVQTAAVCIFFLLFLFLIKRLKP